MASNDDLKQALKDIAKFSPLLGLERQALLQSWVKRLVAAASEEPARALDYAHYLAYQLQRAQLRFPFSQPPGKGSLPNLKEVLFAVDSGTADAASLSLSQGGPELLQSSAPCRVGDTSAQSPKWRSVTYADSSALGPAAVAGTAPLVRGREDPRWRSSQPDRPDRAAPRNWQSRVADPKCEREVNALLEDLAEDTPLWLLLPKICSATQDGGALLQAVVAEELAEWSARLASDQAMASKCAPDAEDGEEDWGPRADRRADYWSEVCGVWTTLRDDDPKAGDELAGQVKHWLNQQSRQLQEEQAQLQALIEELQVIKGQVLQSQKWRQSQFEVQNRALQAEVTALQQSIAESSKRVAENVSGKGAETSATAQRRFSHSQDSLENSIT